MPTQVQFRRGSKAQNDSFSGAAGEIVVNNTNQSIRIHDGTTQGGFELAKVDLTNVSGATNLSLSGITTTNSLSIGSTQVISSARQLQNIVSLDATTTATIESAIAAAPNDFTSLNISGLSTFSGITTHTTSLFGTQASFSGVVTATDFNSTSDINLKDNIQTIVNPLDKIIKLNGVTFNWKENQKPSIGVIAQELQEILPELVSQGDIKSVNYNGLIGVLIEAVKEQQKQIEELKDLVKDLTSTQ